MGLRGLEVRIEGTPVYAWCFKIKRVEYLDRFFRDGGVVFDPSIKSAKCLIPREIDRLRIVPEHYIPYKKK